MKKISIILVILWMILIFSLSNQVALVSTKQSSFFATIIINIVGIKYKVIVNYIVRKLAHFFLYLVLGILVINALRFYKVKNIILLSIMICMTYACSDEIHQLFVAGRIGDVKDVLIDTVGSIIGISIFKLIKGSVLSGNNKTNG